MDGKKLKGFLKLVLAGLTGIVLQKFIETILSITFINESSVTALMNYCLKGGLKDSIVCYVNGLNQGGVSAWGTKVVLPFLVGIFLLYVHRHMVLSGSFRIDDKHIGRVSIRSLVSLVDPIRYRKTLTLIHQFHHVFDHSQYTLNNGLPGKPDLDNEVLKKSTDDLLKKSKEIIDCLLGDDVAVHIKLFDNKSIEALGDVNIKKAKLKAYRRIPSIREIGKRDNKGLTKRTMSEIYEVFVGAKARDFPSIKESYPRNDLIERPRVNTAYNYVLQANEHFFVCNDLEKAEKAGYFYSNSNNWEKFYSSLAVFLICPPVDVGASVEESGHKPLGMLIIDSYSKGMFDRGRLRTVAGFLAHRFYDFFTAISC